MSIILIIITSVKGHSLISEKKIIEENLDQLYKKHKLKWKCDVCGKKFKTKKEAEEHEKKCDLKK